MSEKAFEVIDLCFSYPDGPPALKNIHFTVDSGESFGLIGPNGAGKSTLILHLNGILRGEGFVRVFQECLNRENIKRIRSRIGMVFQDPNDQLFMPTVFDDVAFGLLNNGGKEPEVKDKVLRVLKDLGLEGYEGKSAYHLSLGEKKRVSLATALATSPDILILDEPTSFLDPGTRRDFIRLLKSIEKTKVIASHDLEMVAEICSRVALLDRGMIIAEGDCLDILRDRVLLEAHKLEVPLSQMRTR